MNIRSSVLNVVLAGVFIASSSAQAPKPAKNLIGNGDFSAGTVNWVGDGKVAVYKADPGTSAKTGSALDALKATPPPLPVATPPPPSGIITGSAGTKANADADRSYCVTLGSRVQKFSQRISVPRNATALSVTFRARTSDGFVSSRATTGPFQMKIVYPAGGFTFTDKILKRDPDWQSFKWDCSLREATRSLEFTIEVFPGVGQLYFDDFVIESVGQ